MGKSALRLSRLALTGFSRKRTLITAFSTYHANTLGENALFIESTRSILFPASRANRDFLDLLLPRRHVTHRNGFKIQSPAQTASFFRPGARCNRATAIRAFDFFSLKKSAAL